MNCFQHFDFPGGEEKLMLDTTGAFHWCPNQTLERCTLDGDQVGRDHHFTLSFQLLIHFEFQ